MITQRTAFERQVDEVEEHNNRLQDGEAVALDHDNTYMAKDLARVYCDSPVSFVMSWNRSLKDKIKLFFREIKRKQDIKKGVYSNKQRLTKDGKWEYIK